MNIIQADIKEVLRLLSETPERITAVSQPLTPKQQHAKPDNSSWSLNDNLAHLRACVDVWVNEFDTMLAQDSPILGRLAMHEAIQREQIESLGNADE